MLVKWEEECLIHGYRDNFYTGKMKVDLPITHPKPIKPTNPIKPGSPQISSPLPTVLLNLKSIRKNLHWHLSDSLLIGM
jgi:hypothetical protein